MTWWDKLKEITKREAGAVREEVGKAASALDEALAKKERELAASPAERVDMLLDDIATEDAQFEEIEERLRAKGAERADRAGIDPPVLPPRSQPDVTPLMALLDVRAIPIRPDADDKTSHVVAFRDQLADELDVAALDGVVADLQVHVMVLDASRRDRTIALRTPTLTVAEVAELVAGTVATHAPQLIEPTVTGSEAAVAGAEAKPETAPDATDDSHPEHPPNPEDEHVT